jgi:hypothetical protein
MSEMEEVPTIVPLWLVVSTVEGIWKSVVLPVLLILKSVVVEKEEVLEPMANTVVELPADVEAACMESCAKGEVVPIPILPNLLTRK